MNFERGKDPKEVMEVGRKKDAITIYSVKCYSNGQETIIKDPDIIRIFLDQLSKISFPYNPVFGPQRIVMESSEKYTDVAYSNLVRSLNQSIGQLPASDVDLVERERPIDISLFDYEGKTVVFQEKMYQMPTLNDLKEKGFDFFEKCETNYRKEESDKEKSRFELQKNQLAELKAMMGSSFSDIRNKRIHIDHIDDIPDIEKEISNKKSATKSGFWNPFKNTDPIRLLPPFIKSAMI